ncbi:cadherin-related family member 2 protein [Babesia caballi]|uniref:Cadherin-related family member 2 protein n=1 Tax=Babesia caballi TaxID=5871 RepID=A0AAV4M2Y3_BABCB|nr:cadherin-related family member 2 protein [Babesia caballi]
MRRKLEAREPIEHFSNGCGRPSFGDRISNLFSCEIAATKIEECGEGMAIEVGGGRTSSTDDSLKAVVKLSEHIWVGRVRGGTDIGELIKASDQVDYVGSPLPLIEVICKISMSSHITLKGRTIKLLPLPPTLLLRQLTLPIQVGQPVVIERQAAEEDLGDFVFVGIAAPIGGGQFSSAVVNGGGEDVWDVGAAVGTKLFIIIFNCFDLRIEFPILLPIRCYQGREAGL